MAKKRQPTISADVFKRSPSAQTLGDGRIHKAEQGSQEDKQEQLEHEEQKLKKLRFTVHIPVDLIERVKDCVFHTPGLTISEMAEEALFSELKKRETERGEAFPSRGGKKLRTGRPVK